MAEWVDIPGATSASFSKTAELSDAGSYRCVATNAYGTDTSNVAEVTVVQTLHPDTINYISRVGAADGQTLEPAIVDAWDTFFRAMDDPAFPTPTATTHKEALLAGTMIPILGARTLAASLLPLYPSMPMPTNVGFVTGDYGRATGLKGDGLAKYADLGTKDSDLPQNNYAQIIYVTEAATGDASSAAGIGTTTGNGSSRIVAGTDKGQWYIRNRTSVTQSPPSGDGTGCFGTSRSGPAGYQSRAYGVTRYHATPSQPPQGRTIYAWAVNSGDDVPSEYGDPRMCFVASVAALDLAYMDTCLTTLQSSIAAALA